MDFRQSVNDLIRSDRPESPTDAIFIFGSLVLFGLQIYATLAKVTVPYFEATLLALGGYKTIKVGANWQRAKAPPMEKPDEPVVP